MDAGLNPSPGGREVYCARRAAHPARRPRRRAPPPDARRRYMALVFNDVLDNGMDDERTEHSGTPPSAGVKYAINCWIRARSSPY